MTENSESDLDGDWVDAEVHTNRDRFQDEEDLRTRMFALDMAVTALPTLASMADSEKTKIQIVKRAASEFEQYLKTGSIS